MKNVYFHSKYLPLQSTVFSSLTLMVLQQVGSCFKTQLQRIEEWLHKISCKKNWVV